MPRFKTQRQHLWKRWDRGFLREVRHHSQMICLRFIGIFNDQTLYDDDVRRRWEAAMVRISGCRSLSFVNVTNFYWPSHRDPVKRGIPWRGNLTWRQRVSVHWRRFRQYATIMETTVGFLRAETGCKIMVHCEDVSARWLLGADVHPELIVLDTPLVTVHEARLWPAFMNGRGVVRGSRLAALRWFDQWELGAQRADLLGSHLPEFTRHGEWSAGMMDGDRRGLYRVSPLRAFLPASAE